jgi:hypothetical protein
MGAMFEEAIQQLTEQRTPAKGQAWDSFEHRAADALVSLCGQPEATDETPTPAARAVLQVLVPPNGPAEIAGIPIADSLLEQLRANASIEPVLVDDDRAPSWSETQSGTVTESRPGDPVARRRPLPMLWTTRRACASPPPPQLGWHRRPLEPGPWRAPAIPTSSPRARTPWSETRTCPAACTSSSSTTSPRTNAPNSASQHQDRGRCHDVRQHRRRRHRVLRPRAVRPAARV